MTIGAIRGKHDRALDSRSNVRWRSRRLYCTMVIEKRVRRRLDAEGTAHFGATAEARHRWIEAMLAGLAAAACKQLSMLLRHLATSTVAEETNV